MIFLHGGILTEILNQRYLIPVVISPSSKGCRFLKKNALMTQKRKICTVKIRYHGGYNPTSNVNSD